MEKGVQAGVRHVLQSAEAEANLPGISRLRALDTGCQFAHLYDLDFEFAPFLPKWNGIEASAFLPSPATRLPRPA